MFTKKKKKKGNTAQAESPVQGTSGWVCVAVVVGRWQQQQQPNF